VSVPLPDIDTDAKLAIARHRLALALADKRIVKGKDCMAFVRKQYAGKK
jgi:hypothetical protein